MAHWISSKLKAAENLLQQIDQQAAESLGKNEKHLSDSQFNLEESLRSPGTKPLIKEQFKKNSPVYAANQGTSQAEKQNSEVLSRSNSDINGEGKDGGTRNLNSKSNVIGELPGSDWTELLSTPDRKRISSRQAGRQASNLVSRTLARNKDGKMVAGYTRASSLSPVGGGSEIDKTNGVKRSEISVAGLENFEAGSDNKLKNEDAMPRASSFILPKTETELQSISQISMSDTTNATNMQPIKEATDLADESRTNLMDSLEHHSGLNPISRPSFSTNLTSASEKDEESNSMTDSSTSSDSEAERERKEGGKRSQQTLAARESSRAVEAIKEHENLVAMLEGEKLSLEKILEEQTTQQVKEASELQTLMMETMEAVEQEKQKHNNTRMEAFARLTKLEAVNADLAKSLANAQKNLEIEVDRIAELRQQIYVKEAAHEELRRNLSLSGQNDEKVRASKVVDYETDMLKSEYSFTTDKVGRLQEQASILETSIQRIRSEIEVSTDVEIELKGRLRQLTDVLIQKQAQVETLISEKAMLFLKIEAVSKLVEENRLRPVSTSRNDLETGSWNLPNPKLKERMKKGQQQLGSFVQQLDSLFLAGEKVLKRNRRGRIWALVYLVCLHLWVVYILSSHSSIPEPGGIVSLGSLSNPTNTGGT